nr:DEF-B, IVa2 protein=late-phase-dependent transcriptional activator [adenovirus Ad5, Peptide Partial, 18 aa] [Human adenovirus 5]
MAYDDLILEHNYDVSDPR